MRGCDCQRTQVISDGRSRRSDQHDNEREIIRACGKYGPRSLHEVHCNGKRQDGLIRADTKGAIRMPAQRAPILQYVVGRPRIKRIRTEPILSMCCEQDNKWEIIHNHLER